jgi:hypothetical protein
VDREAELRACCPTSLPPQVHTEVIAAMPLARVAMDASKHNLTAYDAMYVALAETAPARPGPRRADRPAAARKLAIGISVDL